MPPSPAVVNCVAKSAMSNSKQRSIPISVDNPFIHCSPSLPNSSIAMNVPVGTIALLVAACKMDPEMQDFQTPS